MIGALRSEMGFAVAPICRALDVSKSGYYVWKNRKPSARKVEDERIKVAIKDLWNREIVVRHESSHDAGSRGSCFVPGGCGLASRRRAA